jgi:MFS family permease
MNQEDVPAVSTPLRSNRDFQLLWVGQTLSTLGSFASFVALPLLILTVTGSATQAGLVAFIASTAAIVTSLPGGGLVDNCNRKMLMLVCDLGRGVAMVLLAAAVMADKASLPLILAVAAVDGTLGTLFAPAEVASLQRIVSAEQLPRALAANQTRMAAAALAGPPLGGVLLGVSRSLPFVANALSYGVSFLSVLFVRTPLDILRTHREKVVLDDLIAGLNFLGHHSFLRCAMINDAVLNFSFSGLLLVVITASVRQGSSGLSTGVVIALAGAASLLGALLAPKVQTLLSPRQIVLMICWTTAVLVPLMALNLSTVMLGAIVAACSVLAPIENVIISALRILATPDHLQGRVQSASSLASMSATPLGPLMAGSLLDHTSTSMAFLAFGGLLTVLALWNTASQALRQFPQTQPTPPVTSTTNT